VGLLPEDYICKGHCTSVRLKRVVQKMGTWWHFLLKR